MKQTGITDITKVQIYMRFLSLALLLLPMVNKYWPNFP